MDAEELRDRIPGGWALRLTAAALVIAVAAGVFVGTQQNQNNFLPVPRTHAFAATLSATGIYDTSAPLAELVPGDGYHLYELASTLFSDSSSKDRLVHVPAGETVVPNGDGMPEFPEGSVMVKTFYYDHDERDPALGQQIIETRLLVLAEGEWNVATYVWNDEQTEATLLLDGMTTPISWVDDAGVLQTIEYEVPDEQTCTTCHQNTGAITPLGPELQYLNLDVERAGGTVNQLRHLTSVDVLPEIDPATIAAGADYTDTSLPIAERARAYLDMNCAHCHNPDGWTRPANEGLDFRFETPLAETGILEEERAIQRNFANGEMPFVGTTTIDEAGLALVEEYLANN